MLFALLCVLFLFLNGCENNKSPVFLMSSNVVKHKSRKIGYMKFSVIDLVKNCFICFSHCVIVHCKMIVRIQDFSFRTPVISK